VPGAWGWCRGCGTGFRYAIFSFLFDYLMVFS
jgi:hypothetical protein